MSLVVGPKSSHQGSPRPAGHRSRRESRKGARRLLGRRGPQAGPGRLKPSEVASRCPARPAQSPIALGSCLVGGSLEPKRGPSPRAPRSALGPLLFLLLFCPIGCRSILHPRSEDAQGSPLNLCMCTRLQEVTRPGKCLSPTLFRPDVSPAVKKESMPLKRFTT